MKLTVAAPVVGLLAMSPFGFAADQKSSNLRAGRNLQAEEELEGTFVLTEVQYEDHHEEEPAWTLALDNGELYDLEDVPPEWAAENGSTLQSGQSKLKVKVQRSNNGRLKVKGKPELTGTDRAPGQQDRRRLAVTGSKTILAIRVIAKDGTGANVAPTRSLTALSDDVFGTNGDPVNLKSQYAACSHDKLILNKAADRTCNGSVSNGSVSNVADGVMQVEIPTVVSKDPRSDYDMRNAVATAVSSGCGVGVNTLANHIMYCLPKDSFSGIAYAGVGSWYSVYNDQWCHHVSGQLHELGHNLYLAHSNEQGTYRDQSGFMGYSYSRDDDPMCFNAAKNYQLGWFADKFDDVTSPTGTLDLYGAEDYSDSRATLVGVRMPGDSFSLASDYFVSFNRANGANPINKWTQEGANQVLVHSRNKGTGYSVSELLCKISATGCTGQACGTGPTCTGGGLPLAVKVDSITLTNDPPAFAEVQIGNIDQCPNDPSKTEPGVCGCGVADTDSDGDGTPNCNDDCPNDPSKTDPGICGCGTADTDTDGDETPNCNDNCPNDPNKTSPGVCGCGNADVDSDSDGTLDCNENCPTDPLKTEPGVCGCGTADVDSDNDGTLDCNDNCPTDPLKTEPGVCGCGVADTDSDGDGTPNCDDNCPNDPNKTEPGICGCGTADTDTDGDETPNCIDNCPNDPNKTEPGVCGCGEPEGCCVDDSDCNNGLYCDGIETCNAGRCEAGTPPSCDDGIACTDDFCNEATDSCDSTPNDTICDNDLFCDGSETCVAGVGCQSGAPPHCDDGVACTVDSCNENTDSCDNIANDSMCDNGLFCDGAETCNAVNGCQAGTDPCSTGDTCDENDDVCVPPPTDSPTKAPTGSPTTSPTSSPTASCLGGGGRPGGGACTESNKSECCSNTCTGGKKDLRTCEGGGPGPAPAPTTPAPVSVPVPGPASCSGLNKWTCENTAGCSYSNKDKSCSETSAGAGAEFCSGENGVCGNDNDCCGSSYCKGNNRCS